MLRWITLAAATLVGLSGAATAQERPTQVAVDAVRSEPFSQTVPILGRLVANQRGEVAALVAGAVQSLEVQVGDRVAAGDVIAVIDETRLEARAALARASVVAAESQIEADKAALSLLEQERARLARLRSSAAFSPAALEDKVQEIQAASARISRAEAELDEALAELQVAERDLADARIVAPYPGVVTQRYTSAGDYVQIGEPVVALIDDDSLEIEADVPSPQARSLTAGAEVAAVFETGATGNARVRAVIPDENPLTRTRTVRLALEAGIDDSLLASGESVTIEFPVGVQREVVTVHKDAVLRRPNGAVVFVAADGAATPRPVVLGDAVGVRVVVEQGLEVGDLVVIRGNERLRPGQPIAFEAPPTASEPVVSGSAS